MSASNRNATNEKSNIPCLEVLISKSFISKNDNLYWTLSIYSLENQPVEKNRSLHNAEIFHFMLFDWERTIQNLLEGNQISYSIVQYFTPETIYCETSGHEHSGSERGLKFLSSERPLEKVKPVRGGTVSLDEISETETADSIH